MNLEWTIEIPQPAITEKRRLKVQRNDSPVALDPYPEDLPHILRLIPAEVIESEGWARTEKIRADSRCPHRFEDGSCVCDRENKLLAQVQDLNEALAYARGRVGGLENENEWLRKRIKRLEEDHNALVAQLQSDRDTAKQQLLALEVLRKVEWIENDCGTPICNVCCNGIREGHSPDCALAEVLRGHQ